MATTAAEGIASIYERQPLREAVQTVTLDYDHNKDAGQYRTGSPPAQAGNNRKRRDGEHRSSDQNARGIARPRGGDEHRRFRHRLLLAKLLAPPSDRHPEDRSIFH